MYHFSSRLLYSLIILLQYHPSNLFTKSLNDILKSRNGPPICKVLYNLYNKSSLGQHSQALMTWNLFRSLVLSISSISHSHSNRHTLVKQHYSQFSKFPFVILHFLLSGIVYLFYNLLMLLSLPLTVSKKLITHPYFVQFSSIKLWTRWG